MAEIRRILLPSTRDEFASLRCGEQILLSGTVYTMRDAGHIRTLEYLERSGELPYGLAGQVIFYAGPTPSAAGRPLGAIGPTTSSRMDYATPRLFEAGLLGCIGKGARSPQVVESCKQTGSVYFAAVGGSSSFLARCVKSAQIVAWEDLGTEALRRLELVDFPVFVAFDTQGNDLYAMVAGASL